MTNQEIFDKVVAHLRKQNARSVMMLKCLYRGPNGLKCAVGCLISDDAYSRDLETRVVGASKVQSALLASGVPNDETTIDMLRSLQQTHDYQDISNWEHYFMSIAERYNLKYSQP